MLETLTFDALLGGLDQVLDGLPDFRRGQNIHYTIKDAGLGAFAAFYLQSPSFLAHQRTLQRGKGRSNAESLFGLEHIPCDNQIRNLLDPIDPQQIFPLFDSVYQGLEQAGELSRFRSLGDQRLIALDGTEYFSSQALHCEHCSHRTHPNGVTTYFHQAITPVLVAPGQAQVVALRPEFIRPQDGHQKQDCERTAAKRWLSKNGKRYGQNVTFLGDDLYCNQPFCEQVQEQGGHFLLVCKPDSHQTLYAALEALAAQAQLEQVSVRQWNGRFHILYHYRYAHQVPLREGKDALPVNWCELTMTHTDGTVLYQNAFATDHRIDRDNVSEIVTAGRTRWKIENEHNNVLKTKGYHLEHNYGHGKRYLSALLLTLNLLAFLFHTVLELVDEAYQVLRRALGTRQTFFNDLRALTRYFLFHSWTHLLDFMIQQLELGKPPPNSS